MHKVHYRAERSVGGLSACGMRSAYVSIALTNQIQEVTCERCRKWILKDISRRLRLALKWAGLENCNLTIEIDSTPVLIKEMGRQMLKELKKGRVMS